MTHWTMGITATRGVVLHLDCEDLVLVPPEALAWHAERVLRAANEAAGEQRARRASVEALGGTVEAQVAFPRPTTPDSHYTGKKSRVYGYHPARDAAPRQPRRAVLRRRAGQLGGQHDGQGNQRSRRKGWGLPGGRRLRHVRARGSRGLRL